MALRSGLSELADLRAYCRVVDLGSITKAASSLRETKGAISRRLLRLERRVGVSLLSRTPRLVTPTAAGLEFRRRVATALDILDEAHVAASQSQQAQRGLVRVTAAIDFGAEILAPLIARFTHAFPEIRVEVLLTDEYIELHKQGFDVAFRLATALLDSNLVARRLSAVAMSMVASPTYLSHRGTPTTFDELPAHRLLAFRPPQARAASLVRTARPSETWPLAAKPAVLVNDCTTLRKLALLDAGIAMVPSIFVAEDVLEGRLVLLLREFSLKPEMSLFLIHRPKLIPAPVRAFCDFVVRSYRESASPSAAVSGYSQGRRSIKAGRRRDIE